MDKVKQNEPCPCGSGLEYRRCCLIQELLPSLIKKMESLTLDEMKTVALRVQEFIDELMTEEEVKELSTADIITRLKSSGIMFEEKEFFKNIETFTTVKQLSDHWHRQFKVTAVGREREFPNLAARVLWSRLSPESLLPIELVDDLINEGLVCMEEHNSARACDVWLKAWAALKSRIRPQVKTVDDLEEQLPEMFFSLTTLFEDLEMELQNAGLNDSAYYEKCITYCKEFCHYFPEEDETTLHTFRKAIAASLYLLGKEEEGIREFDQIIKDYPDNIWSYISYGDVILRNKNKDSEDLKKAKSLYEEAITYANNKEDREIVLDRLNDLEM